MAQGMISGALKRNKTEDLRHRSTVPALRAVHFFCWVIRIWFWTYGLNLFGQKAHVTFWDKKLFLKYFILKANSSGLLFSIQQFLATKLIFTLYLPKISLYLIKVDSLLVSINIEKRHSQHLIFLNMSRVNWIVMWLKDWLILAMSIRSNKPSVNFLPQQLKSLDNCPLEVVMN